jgi:hypothetical protein
MTCDFQLQIGGSVFASAEISIAGHLARKNGFLDFLANKAVEIKAYNLKFAFVNVE